MKDWQIFYRFWKYMEVLAVLGDKEWQSLIMDPGSKLELSTTVSNIPLKI